MLLHQYITVEQGYVHEVPIILPDSLQREHHEL